MSARFHCEDCGSSMQDERMCLMMFSPVSVGDSEEGYHRISNLCSRCQNLKRADAMKRYPPRYRRPVRVRLLRIPSADPWALELFSGVTLPEPVTRSELRPLWLYGRGELGHLARSFFDYVGVEVGGMFEYDEPAPLDAQVAVCIVRSRYAPIEQRLIDRGFRDVVPFYDLAYPIRGDHPLANGWMAEPEDISFPDMESVLRRWDDGVSRAHYLQFLGARILGEEWVFDGTEVTKDNLFFIPEVVAVLRDCEVFLDGGAYDGEMSAKLLQYSPKSLVVAVEPDDENRRKIPADDRQEICGFALAEQDSSGEPFAEGFGVASRLMPGGKVHKPTRCIDSLGIDPTFVKLHLEGGDLAALRGTYWTLARCRPIVAVRVDHDRDGLWRTADYLMNLDNYRFLFRNHCWRGAAATVYAIPRERQT